MGLGMISLVEGTRKTAVCAFSADAVKDGGDFSVPFWKGREAGDEGLVERGWGEQASG